MTQVAGATGSKKLFIALSYLCSINGFALAEGETFSSRLAIHIPHSLFKENGYDHREALFGIPSYGGSIAQNMYYADSDLCYSVVDTRKGYPARENDEDGKMKPWPSPYILMVDRGGCSFVQKVRNAQNAGAAGVIIADNACLCSDTECMATNPNSKCQYSEPIMADDGSGSDITIPSFLMFKHDADRVKDELIQGSIVQLEMTWAIPSPDDRVEYDLWTTPTDYMSKNFLTSFMPVSKALGDSAYFTPHMFIYDGVKNGCTGNGENQCYNLCTNNGRYCAIDPDHHLDKGISGADVVDESLRRICIWKHYGESDGVGLPWWNYINLFIEKCHTFEHFTDENCIEGVFKEAKIDKGVINQCMKDSGGTTADTQNTFLEEAIANQKKRGIILLPSAFVNTAIIPGTLNVNNVFGAICSGYLEGTRPDICEKCAECPDQLSCALNGKCSVDFDVVQNGGVSMHMFMSSILFVGMATAGVALYHYRKTQRDMREQVRGILAEYMPLEDQEGGGDIDVNPAIDFARSAGDNLLS